MDEPTLTIFLKLVQTVGAPAAIALTWIWLYHKVSDKLTKEILQHFDAALTKHFDQLRRDLETKIENTVENKLHAYFLQLDLDRSRGREKR